MGAGPRLAVTDGVLVAAAVTGQPFFFLLAYCAAMAVPVLWVDTAGNTGRPFLPLFLPLLAAVFALRYRLWAFRRRRSGRGLPAQPLTLFVRAHKPALAALPVTVFASVAPVEGNAFGFVVLPLLLALSLSVGVMVWRRIRAIG